MAVKTFCPHCKKSFSAPEEYRGKKIDCPACGRRFSFKSQEDLQAVQVEEDEAKKRREEDKEKIALMERADARHQKKVGKPYYEEFQTGLEGVRHFNPKATSRFLRLRALSDFLVLGAYVEVLLVAVGLGLLIHLKISGVIGSVATLFALIVGVLVLGIGLFLFFKYLGELAFLLADVGDQQNDVVQLLQDIRENTERREAEKT